MEAAIIEHEALRLPDGQKAVLIEKLINSISPVSKGTKEAWIEECDERMEALKNEQVSLVDGTEAINAIRSSLK